MIAVVVMNRTEQELPFALKYNGLAACASSLAHSIMTLRFDAFPDQL